MLKLTDAEHQISRNLPANGHRWIAKQISSLPEDQQPRWIQQYKAMLQAFSQAGALYQNTVSRDFNNRLREAVTVASVTMSLKDEVKDLCADLPQPAAHAITRAAENAATADELADLIDRVNSEIAPVVERFRQWGVTPDVSYNEINRRAVELADEWRIQAIEQDREPDNVTRESDPAHWRRQLKRVMRQGVEGVTMSLENLGLMRPSKWVSGVAKSRHKDDRKMAADYASRRAFVNDSGEAISAEALMNPDERDKRRYAEYTARWTGICDLATDEGLLFSGMITITLPPEYHRRIQIPNTTMSRENKHWNGYTPKQCHDIFQLAWTRIRARWSKEQIRPHYIRAAQPHKDGTPHYHITVMCRDRTELERMGDIVTTCILDTCPTDRADDYRRSGVDIMPLVDAEGRPDPKGALKYGLSALSYLLPSGDDSRSPEEVAAIAEWSKIWGLRRFTTSHGHSTLWNEMRKTPDTGHPAQAAAKAGDYAAFYRALEEAEARAAGVCVHKLPRINKYGEEYKKPHGWRDNFTIYSREHEWSQVWADEVFFETPETTENRQVTVKQKHQAGGAEAPPEPPHPTTMSHLFDWVLNDPPPTTCHI